MSADEVCASVPHLPGLYSVLHLRGKNGVLFNYNVRQTIKMHKNEPDEWDSFVAPKKSGCGTCGSIILALICLPFILIFIPFPETPIKAYPVYGRSSFDVLNHKVILSLGAFEQYEQSQYGMKRHFRIWTDIPNERRETDSVSIKCQKLEYRIDGADWKEAERTPEGDYPGGGSARIWYWSPILNDLDLIDANRKAYKMRQGHYDLRASFVSSDGAVATLETTLQLGEKTVRKWTSFWKILDELSGIH